jgi:hypothetical protein
MHRRAVLAGIPAALTLGGCTDLLSGEDATFEASPAVVAEDAASETGYQERRIAEQRIERTYERVDRTVVVRNVIAEYAREVSLGPIGGELARFTVLSSPTVEVGPIGPLNPIKDMDNREIAEMVQEQYGTIENLQAVGERQVPFLGGDETVTKFSGEARTEGGETVDVFVHISRTQSEDDFVLAIGVHPREVDDEDEVDTLVEGIRHPADDVTVETPSQDTEAE